MTMDAIDLGALDVRKGAEAGFPLKLRHPGTGEVLAAPGDKTRVATLLVRGYDSDTYQAAQAEQQRRRLERMPHQRPTVEQLEDDALTLAAALVAGAERLAIGGQPFVYTPENAKGLLHRFPWIREQVEEAAGKRANFLPGPASG